MVHIRIVNGFDSLCNESHVVHVTWCGCGSAVAPANFVNKVRDAVIRGCGGDGYAVMSAGKPTETTCAFRFTGSEAAVRRHIEGAF